jgi:WD40 repeat protein
VAISIMCICGQQYRVREECAGQQVRCTCGQVLTVPMPPQSVRPAPQPRAAVPAPVSLSRSRTRIDEVLPVDDPPPRHAPSGGSNVVVWLLVGLAVLLLVGGAVTVVVMLSGSTDGTPMASGKDSGPVRDDKLPRDGDPPRNDNPARDGNVRRDDGPGPLPIEGVKDELTLAPEVAPTTPPPATWEKKHTAPIRSVAFSRDGRHALSASGPINSVQAAAPGGDDKSVRLWDARTGKQLKVLDGFKDGLSAVAFSPGGRFAVLGSAGKWEGTTWVAAADHNVHLWDVQEGRELIIRGKGDEGDDPDAEKKKSAARYKGHTSDVYTVAFSPDGRLVASGSLGGAVILWDFDGTERKRYQIPQTAGAVFGTAFSPRGDLLVTGHPVDMKARIVEAATGNVVRELTGHTDAIHCVAWSPDGKYIATGSGWRSLPTGWEPGTKDYTVRLWDAETGAEVHRFTGHTNMVSSVAFTPDSRRILSASHDLTVRLWDIESKREVLAFKGHTAPVRSVAVSPDGRYALSGGDDATLRLWEMPVTVRDLVDVAKRKDLAALIRLAGDVSKMGPESRAAIPPLLDMLKDADLVGRKTILKILDQLGAPDRSELNKLIALLDRGSSTEARLYAAGAVGKMGAAAAPAVAALAGAVKDADIEVCRRAAKSLGDIGPEAKSAAPALREALTTGDKDLVILAAESLGKSLAKGAETGTALAKLLDSDSAEVRTAALKSLEQLGPEGVSCGKLLKLIGDSDMTVSKSGIDLLNKKEGALTDADVGEMRAALKGDNVRTLAAVVDCLTRAGATAKAAVPEIVALAKHPNEGMRLAALKAVEAIDPDGLALTEARVGALKDRDRKLRELAAVALANARSVDAKILKAEVLPVLIEALKPETPDDLKNDGPWVQASEALMKVGKPHIDVLMSALDTYKGRDEAKGYARIRILTVIKGFGKVPNATKYLAKLIEIQKTDPFPTVRAAADAARRAIQ